MPFHNTLQFVQYALLRHCSPASGMSHRTDGRWARGIARRGGCVSVVSGRANGRAARFTRVRTPSRTGFQPVWGWRDAQAARSTTAAWGHAVPYGLDGARPSRNARLEASHCRTGIITMRHFYENSHILMRQIYNVVLHLDGRNATICGQGGKRHV